MDEMKTPFVRGEGVWPPAVSDAELKQVAQGIFAGTVFTSNHVAEPGDLQMVFLPLAFGCFSDVPREDLNNIGTMYEYLSEASPRSLNGMPIFFSLRLLNWDDTRTLQKYYLQVKAAMESI